MGKIMLAGGSMHAVHEAVVNEVRVFFTAPASMDSVSIFIGTSSTRITQMLKRPVSTQINSLLYCLAHSMWHDFVNVSYSSSTLNVIFTWKFFSRLQCHKIG